jgi:hypothetical protein
VIRSKRLICVSSSITMTSGFSLAMIAGCPVSYQNKDAAVYQGRFCHPELFIIQRSREPAEHSISL